MEKRDNPTRTEIQQRHHDDQLAAARAEFDRRWECDIKPALFNFDFHQKLDDRDFAFLQHIAWNIFRAGLRLE